MRRDHTTQPAAAQFEVRIERERKTEEPAYFGPMIGAHYELVEMIGSGGMGLVYLAKDLRDDSTVAIKIGRQAFNDAHIAHETSCLRALSHSNIVRPFESGVDIASGRAFVAMERISGESLQELLDRDKRLSLEEAIEIALPLLDALEHVHEAGMLHGDVKPSNILIDDSTSEPRPVLIDFGLCRRVDDHNATQGGTLTFMAPEQALSPAVVDHRADLYSVGALLYAMVAGRPLVNGRSSVAELVAAWVRPPPPMDGLPDMPLRHRMLSEARGCSTVAEAFEKVLAKAVANKAADRYQSAGELAFALQVLLRSIRSSKHTSQSYHSMRKVAAVGVALLSLAAFAPEGSSATSAHSSRTLLRSAHAIASPAKNPPRCAAFAAVRPIATLRNAV